MISLPPSVTVLSAARTRVTYTHDAASQLTREQRGGAHPIDETLSYDAVGNRVSKVDATGTTTYQLNAANELVLTTPPTGAPTTSTWDADGNLAQEDTGGQKTDYTWDSENRLVRIDHPDSTFETNTYRADGLRNSHEDTDGLVYFIWDGQNVLLEKNSSRVTRAIYTQLPGIWGGAFSFKRGADHYFLLPDLQGHTRHLANAAGAVTHTFIYDAWGREIWPIVGTGVYLRPFGQWGYWRDTASRLYVRARHLRVELGRWVSRDPIRVHHLKGTYRYVQDAPLRWADPTGLVPGEGKYRCCKHAHELGPYPDWKIVDVWLHQLYGSGGITFPGLNDTANRARSKANAIWEQCCIRVRPYALSVFLRDETIAVLGNDLILNVYDGFQWSSEVRRLTRAQHRNPVVNAYFVYEINPKPVLDWASGFSAPVSSMLLYPAVFVGFRTGNPGYPLTPEHTFAHELGHMLTKAGHVPGDAKHRNNLMLEGGAGLQPAAVRLLEEQCDMARASGGDFLVSGG